MSISRFDVVEIYRIMKFYDDKIAANFDFLLDKTVFVW